MIHRTLKIAISIVIVGIFSIFVFLAISLNQLPPGFSIVISFLLIFIFFFGIAAGQRLTLPLKKILKEAIELSKDDFSRRVYVETNDELAELANIFNDIAQKLEASRELQENAEKSINIKVRARTEELEETIKALEQKVMNRSVEMEKLMKESSQLKEDLKNKNAELAQLKKELGGLNKKLDKPAKSKPEIQ